MEQISLSSLDELTLAILRQRAKQDGKSIDQEAADLLRDVLGRAKDADSLIARARAISAMAPKSIEQSDSTLLIREDRDR
jgi:plasmid stability protein